MKRHVTRSAEFIRLVHTVPRRVRRTIRERKGISLNYFAAIYSVQGLNNPYPRRFLILEKQLFSRRMIQTEA